MGTHVAGGRSRPRRGSSKEQPKGRDQRREIAGLALIGLGILLASSLFLGFGVGPVGGAFEDMVRALVGLAVVLTPFALAAAGLALILRLPAIHSPPFRLGVAIGAVALVVAFAAGTFGVGGPLAGSRFDIASVSQAGGYVGEVGYVVIGTGLGDLGTAVVVIAALIAAVVLVTGASLGLFLRRSGQGAATASRGAARAGRGAARASRGMANATLGALRRSTWITDEVRAKVDALEAPTLVGLRGGRARGADRPFIDGAGAFPDLFEGPSALPPSPALGREAGGGDPFDVDDLEDLGADEHVEPAPPAEPGPQAEDDGVLEPESRLPFPLAPPQLPHPEPVERDAQAEGDYRLPAAELLRRSAGSGELSDDQIAETSRRLEEALGHFGVQAQVSNAVPGPRVTRYELQLAPGTKVGRVTALRDDLAYALAAREELRIIAPIPGKQAVGVEVPNPEAALVTLGDIYREFPAESGPLVAWLGLDIGGKPVYVDLARMPHLLIAGSTGTGKSVCLNALLASVLLRSGPDELRMILIDPKKVELNHYESLPHLLTKVVTSPNDAAAVLANVVREMEGRYELMGLARARNLRDWNAARAADGEDAVPTILVVIDELADLMMVAPAEVEDAIIRLAQKSRAVGIHLVLATQRPSADVITGMIKANVPSRIAFAVSSQVDSRVILDANGAESLLGQGDMLFRPVGSSRLQRLQGAYVSEEEIRQLTDAWREQRRPELRQELLERPEAAEDAADRDDADLLLGDAIEMVVRQGTASVSLLQRRLGVGYARAGRLVDAMERLGAISGYEGSRLRRVLVGEADLPRLIGRGDAGQGVEELSEHADLDQNESTEEPVGEV